MRITGVTLHAEPTGMVGCVFRILFHNVDRQGDEYWPLGVFMRDLESPGHNHCHLVCVLYLDTPFHDGLCHCDEIMTQQRSPKPDSGILRTRGDDHGRRIFQTAIDHTDGIPQARCHVHVRNSG